MMGFVPPLRVHVDQPLRFELVGAGGYVANLLAFAVLFESAVRYVVASGTRASGAPMCAIWRWASSLQGWRSSCWCVSSMGWVSIRPSVRR